MDKKPARGQGEPGPTKDEDRAPVIYRRRQVGEKQAVVIVGPDPMGGGNRNREDSAQEQPRPRGRRK